MSVFNGKTLMITGGTGSFGNAVLNRPTSAKSAFFQEMKKSRTICAMSSRRKCPRSAIKSNSL